MRDPSRYGEPSRGPALWLGLPVGLALAVVGGYLTLWSWGTVGEEVGPSAFGYLGPIIAGFGVALLWVCLRPRR
ncbi:hypothetical protein [Nocardioides daejeonensis]|uniref:hypothetical protein n=1 Tax=Nocardioides daejeonensis TaxID=1046556 RepID=UPI000D74F888|nr:hypothetical protein [Nocardioides daejeonensis]